ncbi:MAG: DUF2996 domain-containing protein [Cyanobacteria bacterium QH_8_48_120]|jgi:hypothetical protein|nr:MAG: DUF2996 domain-containing protein [Cyanobacteria bacterium QH_6_48_35]PSO75860.1 MAG: DUF2996 domain-containing protein [Cyanobacteria bacterium QH_8_48_120]
MAEETNSKSEQQQKAAEKSEASSAEETTKNKAGTSENKEKSAQGDKAKSGAGKSQSGKSKKEKEPAVEDKPFTEFIPQDFIPSLKEALAKQGIEDIDLTFTQDSPQVPVPGLGEDTQYWQVVGSWKNERRWFNLYFLDEDIKGKKAFSWATNGAQPSTLEPFMSDERKVSLDLLVMYTMQRLNAEKWLGGN